MTVLPSNCARLHERQRKHRGRLAIRAWEYRQRDCAKGAWPRLCRVLADAAQAYEISEEELELLLAEKLELQAAGRDLHPPKRIVFVPAERASSLESRRPIPLHLTPPLLGATCIALVPFAL